MSRNRDADQKKYMKELIAFMRAQKDSQSLLALLEGIMTPSELKEIPKRLQIVKMLREGISQREISETLGVGIATVTRGSRIKEEKIFDKLK